MHVMVFSPTHSYTTTALPGLSSADRVTVVCWANGSASAKGRIAMPRSRMAYAVARALSVHVLLRTALRASPFDPGAVFWRAARKSPDVARAALDADIIVAPERDGAFAAWNAHRRVSRGGREVIAVSGYPAARAVLERMR